MRTKAPFAFSLFVLAAAACAPPLTTVEAQLPSAAAPPRGITVSGLGKASGRPDIARASVGVEVRAETADQAIADANTRMAQVTAALKKAGVQEKDLRTTNVSLDFEQRPMPPQPLPPPPPVIKGGAKGAATPAPEAPRGPQGFYRASNMVEITVRNLDQIGAILSAATSAGANQMFGVQFELEDPSTLESEARRKAFADARARAQQLAQIAGLPLGPAVSISESTGGNGGMWSAPIHMMKTEAAQVPVERGQLTVTTTVQVVFALPDGLPRP